MPSPQTDLLEKEPQLREFMRAALMPRMQALGMKKARLDAMGNLIAEKGDGRGRSMMLVTHAMNQPPNTMPDPYSGNIIDATKHGLPGEAVLGKGASEQKGTMAAMLHAIEAVRDADIPIEGRLYFICCVSGETGKHDAIRNVVEKEGVRADVAFVYGNSLKLQLGNRTVLYDNHFGVKNFGWTENGQALTLITMADFREALAAIAAGRFH